MAQCDSVSDEHTNPDGAERRPDATAVPAEAAERRPARPFDAQDDSIPDDNPTQQAEVGR
ncbi:hypothetical protein GCM10023318_24220 [Nocardia callitridis]|uniref:Uncharacterized protein n=1 Tax=Nocardia callitridis TaxID=648753 RepID=A0ABP9K977_9NOCA